MEHLGEKIWVSVIDNGSGIAALDLPHIFERFYRGNMARGGANVNAGIGLSIVRRICDMHGEIVEAANAPQGGALFRFSLSVAASGNTACTREQFPA